jgi:hypothetical protein
VHYVDDTVEQDEWINLNNGNLKSPQDTPEDTPEASPRRSTSMRASEEAMLQDTAVTRRSARAVTPDSFAATHTAGVVKRYSNLNMDSDAY